MITISDESPARNHADILRQEAKDLLLMALPDGTNLELIERLVDCLVTASFLEVAAMQEDTVSRAKGLQ